MDFEIIDPEVINFVGEPIKIITKEDREYLGKYHKVGQIECELEGIKETIHTLYGQKGLGLFIKVNWNRRSNETHL